MNKNRFWLSIILLTVIALVLAACAPASPTATTEPDVDETEEPAGEETGGATDGGATEEPVDVTDEPAPTAEPSDFKFVLITPNPRGDRSYIDASVRGVDMANEELGL